MLKRLLARKSPVPVHPIDREFGIDTSGTISARRLFSGNFFLDRNSRGYVGSQPSVIGGALEKIVDLTLCETFVDLGCGKGRAMVVAAHYGFEKLIGIELNGGLARIARRNLAKLNTGEIPVLWNNSEIVIGDASAPDLAGTGSTVIYLYNSFGEPVVRKLLTHLEAHAAANPNQKLWFVYYNPVWSSVIDESKAFSRFFADRIEFDAEEAAANSFDNRSDSVVIWQSRAGEQFPPLPGHDRKVLVTIPDRGADVQ